MPRLIVLGLARVHWGEVGMKWRLISDREQRVSDGGEPVGDAAFWASPVGQAARAKLRGDRFFQIELDDATLTDYAETARTAGGRRVRRTCDLLGQIEELGWHLEHVSWWHEGTEGHTTAEPRARHAEAGERLCGVYLFHSVPTADLGGSEEPVGAGATHTPQHRRDVS
jgi:hypothetical protein